MDDVVEKLREAIEDATGVAIRTSGVADVICDLQAAGFQIVPVEPTEAMCWAGWSAEDAPFAPDARAMLAPARVYRAMLTAAKQTGE